MYSQVPYTMTYRKVIQKIYWEILFCIQPCHVRIWENSPPPPYSRWFYGVIITPFGWFWVSKGFVFGQFVSPCESLFVHLGLFWVSLGILWAMLACFYSFWLTLACFVSVQVSFWVVLVHIHSFYVSLALILGRFYSFVFLLCQFLVSFWFALAHFGSF